CASLNWAWFAYW
nr:immunoglobulin heavy chain junction region [Mus musculus]